jgi:hypothetical protein
MWLSAVLLNPLFGGSGLHIPEFSIDLLIGLVINFVLLFLVNSEELVWRGSMLPRLQARWSALGPATFIGVYIVRHRDGCHEGARGCHRSARLQHRFPGFPTRLFRRRAGGRASVLKQFGWSVGSSLDGLVDSRS